MPKSTRYLHEQTTNNRAQTFESQARHILRIKREKNNNNLQATLYVLFSIAFLFLPLVCFYQNSMISFGYIFPFILSVVLTRRINTHRHKHIVKSAEPFWLRTVSTVICLLLPYSKWFGTFSLRAFY